MYSYIFHFDIIISLTTPIIDYYLAYITPSYLPILKKKERMIIKIPTLLADILSSDQTAKAQQICLETMFKSILSFDKPVNSLPVTKNAPFYIPYRTQKYAIWLNNRDCPK